MHFQRFHLACGLLLLLSSAAIPIAHAEETKKQSDQAADPTGTWIWSREFEGQSAQSILKLVQTEGKLTGSYQRQEYEFEVQNGKVDGNRVTFELEGEPTGRKVKLLFDGTIKGDAISGKIQISADEGSLDLDWEAKRGIDPADVVGRWEFQIQTDGGQVFEPSLVLKRENGKFQGTYTSEPFGEFEAKEIKLEGITLSFVISGENDGNVFKVTYIGKPAGDKISGEVQFDLGGQNGSVPFTGTHSKPDDEKEKPKEADSK